MAFDYKRYLASREWAVLRERVRERSGDECERCRKPMQAVHHQTYERIGHENLDDLQAVCNPCHEFLSAKSDQDPAAEFIRGFKMGTENGLDVAKYVIIRLDNLREMQGLVP